MDQSIGYESKEGRIVIMDSVAYLTKENEGDVIVCGSHGGRSAAEHAIKFRPRGIIFNDAGKGKENAGIGGLTLLDENGIMGATVDTMSARIGDGSDTYESGIISAVNNKAEKVGIRIGMQAKEAAMIMVRSSI
ncbi:MAG: hypothetical protein HY739_04735 [Desulfobacterales bacterium]|nr:hypothetical protein [Desulfobacterales bacterium]